MVFVTLSLDEIFQCDLGIERYRALLTVVLFKMLCQVVFAFESAWIVHCDSGDSYWVVTFSNTVQCFVFQLVNVTIKSSSEADKRTQEDCAPGKPFSVFTVEDNQVCLLCVHFLTGAIVPV